jgi:hypothetical protein
VLGLVSEIVAVLIAGLLTEQAVEMLEEDVLDDV